MEKKIYETPVAELIRISTEDIMNASFGDITNDGDNGGNDIFEGLNASNLTV